MQTAQTTQPQPETAPDNERKPYIAPAILHELALETRAGSVLSVDPLDELFGTNAK